MFSILQRKEKYLFYLLLFSIPFQLGKHFWPPFSYVLGYRVDYLSPTVYLTDILIVILFICSGFKYRSRFGKINLKKPEIKLPVILLSSIIAGILLSGNQWAGWYGTIKIIEMYFFGWLVFFYFREKKINIVQSSKIFSASIILQTFIAAIQFLSQKSIGGILYVLGERTFSSETPGIANASISGHLLLRPYGTFSHPNVLAGYLLLTLIFLLFSKSGRKFLIPLCLGTAGLILTMSRAPIIIWILILLYKNFKEKKGKKVALTILLAVLIFVFITPAASRIFQTSFSEESFYQRMQLIQYSYLIFLKHPLLGVGLNNFYSALSHNFSASAMQGLSFLQPVHNIFILALSECGIVAFIALILIFKKVFIKAFKHKGLSFVLLSSFTLLGMTDHYFLTIQQGQLLTAFIVGFSCAV